MQSTEDWQVKHAACCLDIAWNRRILLQRQVRTDLIAHRGAPRGEAYPIVDIYRLPHPIHINTEEHRLPDHCDRRRKEGPRRGRVVSRRAPAGRSGLTAIKWAHDDQGLLRVTTSIRPRASATEGGTERPASSGNAKPQAIQGMPAEAFFASCRLRIAFYKRAGFFRDSAYLYGSLVKSKLEESMRWTGFGCRVGNRYPMRGCMAFSR